ncbi:macrolide 2'-phosphotransferase [Planococcus shenhongbingii]|uniref:Macrolide 2'-phosphotransferase n=1 Tax=Planococcus shenhongbingii TaxID=3058398 RepID=A0ABT8NET7_9BACL|nr:macrolide 2'-phosphotransferase [Planococcus sp. N017]MDN7246377.1 macrolide 2'-phosphotransferase [Planococcus sp. N017]
MEKQRIIELAKKHGFELEGRDWTVNDSGLDFSVVLFEDRSGDRWVLRIPRRGDVQSEIDKEKQILNVLEPNLAIEAPKWEIATEELIAYRALTGVPAGTINKEEQRYDWIINPEQLSENYVSSLAKGMVSLHSIPFEKVTAGGLAIQTIDDVRNHMQTRMDNVKREFEVSDLLWLRWQKWIGDDSMWPEHTGFIHGDLHAGHILIDEHENVTGFIDWTEGKVADVSVDFVGHLRAHGKAEMERLVDAYGQAGGIVWPKMKEHIFELAATYPIDIAEFALKSGIDEYLEMARGALKEAE